MKIIFLDLDDIKNPLLSAGQARATLEVGSRFAKMGHKVVSICSKYPNYKDRVENGIEYIHIGLNTGNIQVNNAFYILSLPFVVARLQADIIIECFTAPISSLFSPLFTKIPVVALPTVFAGEQFSKKYHLPFVWFEALGCKLYKYFMPYIDTDETLFRKYNKTAISRMIPQGVGDEYFKIKQKKGKYILYLGRLDTVQKGIDLLLKAYKSVANKIKYPLIIAGGGPDEEKLKKMASDLGLNSKVTFVGMVKGETKYKLLSEAHLVAFPSRYDNLPLFSIEAIASGLPLVTFDIPEFGWLKPEFSFQAKAFNIRDYGQLLLSASKSAKLPDMKKFARNYAKRFKWQKVAKQMTDFFEEILKKEAKI